MKIFGSPQFALLTVGMSLPLLLSFHLKSPPDFLRGLPFVLIWTWAVASALTVPLLVGLQIVACAFHYRQRGRSKMPLLLHATALLVAMIAEVVFISARRTGG
jgi:hypothetical protein